MLGSQSTSTYLADHVEDRKAVEEGPFRRPGAAAHFASDVDLKSFWIYDKGRDRSWISSLLNEGSENDFNTVELKSGKWNFKDLFQDVDGRSAKLVSEIVSRRTLSWITPADHAAMIDLFTTQMLRTKLARSTSRSMALQMREMMRDIGADPDAETAAQ